MMKTRYPLRNAGPRTFISYSFSDREIADRLNFYLSEHGFQVHMEDETSLLGQNLTESLPLRIGDCEVFIPLLTKMANDSTWMRKEFDWALAHQGMHPYRLILPVVFDRDYLYQPLHDWAYVDATSSGLTQDLLALIAHVSLQTVELLPLSEGDIFQFEQENVEMILNDAPGKGKRIIVDSDGVLLTLMHEILDFAAHANHPSFLAQEQEHERQIKALWPAMDQVIPRLVAELQFAFKNWGRNFPCCAMEAMSRFSKLTIGRHLLKCAQLLPPDQSTILTVMADRIANAQKIVENAQAQNPGDWDLARMCWALGVYSASGTDRLEWIGLATEKNKLGMTLAFPVKRIGPDWQLLLQMEAAPLSYILPEDWANYCIPQIAAHTVWSAAAQGISIKKVAQRYAWRLSEYQRISLA